MHHPFSGYVRPRQGTEICNFGAPSPLDFCEFSPVDVFSPGLLCNLERKWPQNVEKIARFPGGEKGVESCHVCGCHGCFGPDFCFSWSCLPCFDHQLGEDSLAANCAGLGIEIFIVVPVGGHLKKGSAWVHVVRASLRQNENGHAKSFFLRFQNSYKTAPKISRT